MYHIILIYFIIFQIILDSKSCRIRDDISGAAFFVVAHTYGPKRMFYTIVCHITHVSYDCLTAQNAG